MAVTNFIWDALSDNVLLETDENDATVVAYTHNPSLYGKLLSQDRGGVTSEYHYDGKNSTRQLTDENQNVTDTMTYSAFGEVVAKTGATTNSFGYKGAVGYYTNPETEDLYVRARTYEPTTGRWLSEDPLGFVDGPNDFTYGANNPVNLMDPSGMFTLQEAEKKESLYRKTYIPNTWTSIPVYHDVALNRWAATVGALNNICIRIDSYCGCDKFTKDETPIPVGDPIEGKYSRHHVQGVDFLFYVTVPTINRAPGAWIPNFPGEYARFTGILVHELQHFRALVDYANNRVAKTIDSILKKHDGELLQDCYANRSKKSVEIAKEIWKVIGIAFTHSDNIPILVDEDGRRLPGDFRPASGVPGVPPRGFTPAALFRDLPAELSNDALAKQGWYCPLAEVILGVRGALFPDWEFNPRLDKRLHPTPTRIR